MDDIFVDNRASHNFKNPMTCEYKKLYEWLLTKGALVVSQKLINEYNRSNNGCTKADNILFILSQLTMKSRINPYTPEQIRDFKSQYYKKHIRFRCNKEDKEHIPIILLSNRKLALIIDDNFSYDVNNFPGFTAHAESNPSDLNYA